MKKIVAVIAALSMGSAMLLSGCTGQNNQQALEEIDKTYNNGEIIESGYSNTFFGVQFKMPQGWINESQEKMDTMDYLVSSANKLVMYSTKPDGSESVNIRITNMKTDTSKYSQDSFIDESIDNLKKSYEDKGYQNVEVYKQKIIFCEEEIPAIKISYNSDGKKVYQVDVILLKGSYYGCITATSINNDKCIEILSNFSKIS